MVNNIYFVEGECEERLINALKKPPALIQPGRVKVFNVVQKRFSKAHLNIEQLWNKRVPDEFNFIIQNSEEVKSRNPHR